MSISNQFGEKSVLRHIKMVKEIIFSYNLDSLLTDITSVLLGGTGNTHLFNSLLTQVLLCLLGEDPIDLFFMCLCVSLLTITLTKTTV